MFDFNAQLIFILQVDTVQFDVKEYWIIQNCQSKQYPSFAFELESLQLFTSRLIYNYLQYLPEDWPTKSTRQ